MTKQTDKELEREMLIFWKIKKEEELIRLNLTSQGFKIRAEPSQATILTIRETIKQSQVGMIKIEDVNKMIDESQSYTLEITNKRTLKRNLSKIGNIIYKDELKQSLKEIGEKNGNK